MRLTLLCVLTLLSVPVLLGLALAAPGDTAGRSRARPGAAATVRLELRLEPGLTVNRLGPSRAWLEDPFTGRRLEAGIEGRPWPRDPTHYLDSVRPAHFALSVPVSARPGERRALRLGAQLALCDQRIRVCFVQQVEGSATFEVSGAGAERPAVLAVGRLPAR